MSWASMYLLVGLLFAAWFWHESAGQRGERTMDRVDALRTLSAAGRRRARLTMLIVGAALLAVLWPVLMPREVPGIVRRWKARRS